MDDPARITLNPGISWHNLPTTRASPMIDQEYLLREIARLRVEWEVVTGGNLEAVTLNLDLFLKDLEALCKGAPNA